MRNLLLVVAMVGMAYLSPANAAPNAMPGATPSAIRVAPAAVAAPALAVQKTRPGTASGGMVDCWKEREARDKACKRNCTVCFFRLFGVCLSSGLRTDCFDNCILDSRAEYIECKDANTVSP